ncbi:MAG: hypothetical protein ABW000_07350 [Actinoplanes sp.]
MEPADQTGSHGQDGAIDDPDSGGTQLAPQSMTDDEPEEAAHIPARPAWFCGECGMPWPCLSAQRDLVAEYTDDWVALSIYLGGQLLAAIDDFYQDNYGSPPDLYERFMSWRGRSDSIRGNS